MTKSVTKSAVSLAALGLLALLQATPVNAALKVWVANGGVDSPSSGATTAPCRTFQQAVNNADVGGEVGVLVPGDYGGANGVSIRKSVSITNDGTGEASIFAPPFTPTVRGAPSCS